MKKRSAISAEKAVMPDVNSIKEATNAEEKVKKVRRQTSD